MDLFTDAAQAAFYHWEVPLMGLLAAGATYLVGRLLVNWQQTRVTTRPPPDPPSPSPSCAETDRRHWLRRGGTLIGVSISDAEGKGPPQDGWVVDRSLGGLCLRTEMAVEAGTILSIRPRDTGAAIPWTKVEVRSCRAHD